MHAGFADWDCRGAACLNKVVTYEDGRYTNGGVFKWLNIILGNVKNDSMAPTTLSATGTYRAIWPNFAIGSIGASTWTPGRAIGRCRYNDLADPAAFIEAG